MNTYIPPTGTIQMMVGVHLNPKQEDTLYFESAGIRDEFFSSYIYASYDEQSYSRPTRDSVKIQDTADRLYKCQYMRFKNGNAFNGQWIYAFVLAVEYINNNTCQVFYAIDDMVTWFPQCTLRECFVEREIPETDNLYENLVIENLDIGEDYVVQSTHSIDFNQKIIILASAKFIAEEGKQYTHPQTERGSSINTFPNALYYEFFAETDIHRYVNINGTSLQERIDQYMGDEDNPDNIAYIVIMPQKIFDQSGLHMDYVLPVTEEVRVSNNLFNYVPKNKKLLTYPYKLIKVSNNAGQDAIFKYELFNSQYAPETPENYVEFAYISSLYGTGSILLYPLMYANSVENIDRGLSLSNFPFVPWTNDAYQAYLAQNKASISTSVLSSVVSSLSGVASIIMGAASIAGTMGFSTPVGVSMIAGGAAAVAHGGTNIASTLGKLSDAKAIPDTVHGLSQTDNINITSNSLQYNIYCMSIRSEQAKIIDDYFSMCGYAQHKVKIPNTHSRPIWNYTKTRGCVVVGDVPASALQNISAIFDRGIRFWKEMAEIGNYEHDNSPR